MSSKKDLETYQKTDLSQDIFSNNIFIVSLSPAFMPQSTGVCLRHKHPTPSLSLLHPPRGDHNQHRTKMFKNLEVLSRGELFSNQQEGPPLNLNFCKLGDLQNLRYHQPANRNISMVFAGKSWTFIQGSFVCHPWYSHFPNT